MLYSPTRSNNAISITMWQCPVCKEELHLLAREAACENNHHFDRARQGYYNLLPANKKSSPQPGDSPAMMAARHAFLSQGHYAPLQDALATMALSAAQKLASAERVSLIELGCGEGTFLGHTADRLDQSGINVRAAGIDVSKAALKLAARKLPNLTFAVANNFQLPIQDAQVNLALVVFAPIDPAELARVLAPEGVVLIVSPGPGHLWELKRLVYDKPQPHEAPALPAGFECLQEDHLRFELTLRDRRTIANLFAMTPYYWHASKTVQETSSNQDALDTTAEFVVRRLRSC